MKKNVKSENYKRGRKDGFDAFLNVIEDGECMGEVLEASYQFAARYVEENLGHTTVSYRIGFVDGAFKCLRRNLIKVRDEFMASFEHVTKCGKACLMNLTWRNSQSDNTQQIEHAI